MDFSKALQGVFGLSVAFQGVLRTFPSLFKVSKNVFKPFQGFKERFQAFSRFFPKLFKVF